MPADVNSFEAALMLHRAGDLRGAEAAYRQVLVAEGQHAGAWHMLALIALASRRPELAEQFALQALASDPHGAEYHAALAEACRGLGRVDDAIAGYRRAVDLRPDYAEAHANLGTLLHVQGDLPAAGACYRSALDLAPDYALAHHNLAIICQALGDLDAAAAGFSEAARLNPRALDSRLALGYLLAARGQAQEAHDFFAGAARDFPTSAAALAGLGHACQCLGRPAEAERHLRQAAELEPALARPHLDLGIVLRQLGRPTEALAVLGRAHAIDPTLADALVHTAGVHRDLKQFDLAADTARRATELAPRSHPAWAQLASALYSQGDLEGTIAAHRRTIELAPHDVASHSNLIYAINAHEDYAAARLAVEHRGWAEQHAEPLTSRAARHENSREPGRRLRVGYVSAHFREHAVAFFSEPAITSHNRRDFEIFCYSDVRNGDAITERFRAAADQWRDTATLDDPALADLIRRDQIDVLVDLAGHIAGNRLLAFARRPAPVQVTYLGYQNTTGMSAMDYRLTDAHADPIGATDEFYTEQLVRLPRAFFCFRPADPAPPVNPLPAIQRGYITFGSLNQSIKLRPHAWHAWMEILRATPNSRLLVLADASDAFAAHLRQRAQRSGVGPERVEIVPKRPRYDYLALHQQIDLALDSFPFNGHTTVCDALWMGVPSMMLEGTSYASRFGSSAHRHLGLEEFVTRGPDQYVRAAVGWTKRLNELDDLRQSLRDRMRQSAIMDAAGFAHDLETEYRTMWRSWCERE